MSNVQILDNEGTQKRTGGIKRIKVKTATLPIVKKEEVKSIIKKIPSEQTNIRDKRMLNYGHGALNPSNMMSEFSSCDFGSIDEFSLNKSNIQVRWMNFNQNNDSTPYKKFGSIRERKAPQEKHNFEYEPMYKRNDRRRRDHINIKPKMQESQVSYVVKEASSYDKSVEVPSSFLEPSIFFDEKDGATGPANKNNVNKYKFKPIFNRERGKPSILENKRTEGRMIQPKTNESESVVACSYSDNNSNEVSHNGSPKKKECSEYFETKKSSKNEEKKPKLQNFITQVDQNADLFPNLNKGQSKGSMMFKNTKPTQKQDPKLARQGHGSTGGADSSHAISEQEFLECEQLAQEACKGRDFVDDPELLNKDQNEEDESNAFSDVHKMHMIQTLQGLLFIRSLPEVSKEEINSKKVFLPPPNDPKKQKVIVFDLDETLVHCMEEFEPSEVDHVLTIEFPNNEVVDAGLNIRPHAIDCLIEANKHFQVIVFTASHSWYANAVLDFIDPNKELIQYRMYRDQCVETPQGIFIKDLRMIGNRALKDVLLVDNASYSFGYQLDNGIPIIPFYNDKKDKELLHLVQYLKWVIDADDVRDQNRKAFQLGELSDQEITEYLNLYSGEEEDAEEEEEEEEEAAQ